MGGFVVAGAPFFMSPADETPSPCRRPIVLQPQRRARTHYVAATFYTLMALLGIVGAIQGKPVTLIATVVAGLYAAYLWRGGRFVIWIWWPERDVQLLRDR